MILPIIIPTQKEKMSKKRIFSLALAVSMLSAQSGAFAKTIADQDFNVAENVSISYPETNIWGGWSTANPNGYRQSIIGIVDGKMELEKKLDTKTDNGLMSIGMQKDISGVTENDDYLVFEFDWYVLRTEVIWSTGKGKYVSKNNAKTAVMPPFGSRVDDNVQWTNGFGLYYTNSEGTDIPLFFMSVPYTVNNFNTLGIYATLGEENPTTTEPKILRSQITDTRIVLTNKDTYRYKFVIDLKNKVNGKYPYELYLKAGDEEYVELTDKADTTYTLTAAEIPSKIRIANQIKVVPQDTQPMWTYDFDDNGEEEPFVEKEVVDNYKCYTIDTDKTASNITYLDVYGNAAGEIVAGETYKASITYNNETENDLSLTMITGLYDAEEYFYDAFEDVVTVPAGMGTLSGEARVFNVNGGDLIKGFAWNNMKDMIPYTGFNTVTAKAISDE